MEIQFRTSKIEKLCNSEKKMRSELGPENAECLKRRLAELTAAENLEVMSFFPAARCHALSKNRKGHFAVNLKHPFRLIFKPDHDPVPQKQDGGIDRESVTAICILEIVDYH